MDSQRMISSSDKQRYSNTVVEFPQPLRENPCTNGHFHPIFLMRVRTPARPHALATLARSFPLPDSPLIPTHRTTPPTTLWLARFARFAFAPGARSALRVLGGRLAFARGPLGACSSFGVGRFFASGRKRPVEKNRPTPPLSLCSTFGWGVRKTIGASAYSFANTPPSRSALPPSAHALAAAVPLWRSAASPCALR